MNKDNKKGFKIENASIHVCIIEFTENCFTAYNLVPKCYSLEYE